jgi:glucosamine--fructose-6-phosphate aminotransferase (isomerizing)
MCGIVGAVGEKKLRTYLIEGLRTLEYRGYDSAGTAFLTQGQVSQFRLPGRIEDLNQLVPQTIEGMVGIGHTRWATHGEPNIQNAHPHASMHQVFTLVHNGVIDNYRILKKRLEKHGYTFQSDTDTEIIVNLLEMHYLESKDVLKALNQTMHELEGSYALAILFHQDDEKVYFAKMHSPMIIGRGEKRYYLASDYLPMLPYAKDFYIVLDHQYGYITSDEAVIKNLNPSEEKPIQFVKTDVKLDDIQLNGYPHYMLKEIEESPQVIQRLKDNYFDGNHFTFDAVLLEKIKQADHIIFLACGTSYHAAMVGRRYFETIGKTSRVYIASEFAYYPEIRGEKPIFIFISQSGETADLIRCLKLLQTRGSTIITMTNTKGSALDRGADFTLLLYAGMEIAVASTKAYIAQVTLLALLRAALVGNNEVITDLLEVMEGMHTLIREKDAVYDLAKTIQDDKHAFFIGRGFDYESALEASLKLKEITYIHSEALPGGELKHGPIALIQKGMPVIALISDPLTAPALRSNIEEVNARGAKNIVIASATLSKPGDAIITPNCKVYLSPLLKIIPMQYLSYYVALLLQRDIDKPRNLAKSVTVE